MADAGQLSDQEAARRRRGWLDGRRRWNRDLAVVLLRYASEAEVARVLDQLPAGELQRLARLLAHAAQLHDHDQVPVPPDRAGPPAATPTRP